MSEVDIKKAAELAKEVLASRTPDPKYDTEVELAKAFLAQEALLKADREQLRTLATENRSLKEHNTRMIEGFEQAAKRHPWYGPCDGIAEGGCAECDKIYESLLTLAAENEELKERLEEANKLYDKSHLAQVEDKLLATQEERLRLGKKLEEAESVLEFVRRELGIPQPGYPAPVSNSCDAIAAYFSKREKGDGK